MITLNLQGVDWRVDTLNGADEQGQPVSMRVLVFVDAQSGIAAHVPLSQVAADAIAAALRGGPAISVVPASAMPPRVRG